MPYIDIRVKFEVDEEEDGYKHYIPVSVLHLNSDLSENDCGSIAESAGQSDTYQVEVSNAFLLALGGGEYQI